MQVLKESCEADGEQTTIPSSGSIGQYNVNLSLNSTYLVNVLGLRT